MVAGHYNLPNFTPLRMLSVWFLLTEGTEVITWERLFMLHELHAQGVSISAIARQTGLDRKTVRRHLAAGIQAPVYGPRTPQGSLLDPYTAYLQTRLDQYPGLSGARLLREHCQEHINPCWITRTDNVLSSQGLPHMYRTRIIELAGKSNQIITVEYCF